MPISASFPSLNANRPQDQNMPKFTRRLHMGILLTSSIVQYFLIFSAPNVSTS